MGGQGSEADPQTAGGGDPAGWKQVSAVCGGPTLLFGVGGAKETRGHLDRGRGSTEGGEEGLCGSRPSSATCKEPRLRRWAGRPRAAVPVVGGVRCDPCSHLSSWKNLEILASEVCVNSGFGAYSTLGACRKQKRPTQGYRGYLGREEVADRPLRKPSVGSQTKMPPGVWACCFWRGCVLPSLDEGRTLNAHAQPSCS